MIGYQRKAHDPLECSCPSHVSPATHDPCCPEDLSGTRGGMCGARLLQDPNREAGWGYCAELHSTFNGNDWMHREHGRVALDDAWWRPKGIVPLPEGELAAMVPHYWRPDGVGTVPYAQALVSKVREDSHGSWLNDRRGDES